jgi:diadenosine tetraphosphate (Ap4A) HIT family hydrolase
MNANEIIYSTENFDLEVPSRPFLSREEGGHLRIMTKLQVSDRTKLSRDQAIEYMKLSMMTGEALTKGLSQRGIDVGIVNYQEMGNWSVFKPEGPIMHMHIFGRAKTATIQKYGQAVLLPDRDTGFYDNFMPLDANDIVEIKKVLTELETSSKYQDF